MHLLADVRMGDRVLFSFLICGYNVFRPVSESSTEPESETVRSF